MKHSVTAVQINTSWTITSFCRVRLTKCIWLPCYAIHLGKHRLLELANLTTEAVGSLPCLQQPATASYTELKYSSLSPLASHSFLPSSYHYWGSISFAIFFFSLCCQINRSGEIFALFYVTQRKLAVRYRYFSMTNQSWV